MFRTLHCRFLGRGNNCRLFFFTGRGRNFFSSEKVICFRSTEVLAGRFKNGKRHPATPDTKKSSLSRYSVFSSVVARVSFTRDVMWFRPFRFHRHFRHFSVSTDVPCTDCDRLMIIPQIPDSQQGILATAEKVRIELFRCFEGTHWRAFETSKHLGPHFFSRK